MDVELEAMDVAGDPGRPALLEALALPPPGPMALLGREDVVLAIRSAGRCAWATGGWE